MRKNALLKWAALLAGGAMLLQVPSCAETATIIGSYAQVVTAGGVIYLIARVLE